MRGGPRRWVYIMVVLMVYIMVLEPYPIYLTVGGKTQRVLKQEPYPIYLTMLGKTQRVYMRSHWFLSTLLSSITYPSTCPFLDANAVSFTRNNAKWRWRRTRTVIKRKSTG
ncbi:hypothetical protein Y032_0770g2213 [Ancylostoma ceylanicum]|nr:hypothetical protein Y032_0770g2213 [Ancylostoma ceylanicum]